MLQYLLIFSGLATIILRLVVGVVYMAHGWRKFKNYQGTVQWFNTVGFKPGKLWGTLVMLAELGGGAMIFLGFFSQVFAGILLIIMLGALFANVRQKQPFFKVIELDLILIAALSLVITLGSGAYSLDTFFSILI